MNYLSLFECLHRALSQGNLGLALQTILWLLPLNGLCNAHDLCLPLARVTTLVALELGITRWKLGSPSPTLFGKEQSMEKL